MNNALCLRDINLYEGIPESELSEMEKEALKKTFPKGSVFYAQGEIPKKVYMLKSGEVELIREENGKITILETLFPGDMFGNFGAGISNHTARVAKSAFVCETPAEEFLKIVKNHPEIAFRLIQALAEKTKYYEEKLALCQQPAKEKIFSEIKFLEERKDQKIFGKLFRVPLRISHQRLAEKTGLNRVTVTKLLNELKNEGRIFVDENTGEIRTK